ncbi:hypothetical protein L6452_19822 [Arctium lappa]|uniref:Uncharacterized protein n=1 Tax=Arctium lappa TaxID=4217 RepID=A0ACB9B953_ARCLA|nr:hypothetical protein L6452_19822 [Arctium lappa]
MDGGEVHSTKKIQLAGKSSGEVPEKEGELKRQPRRGIIHLMQVLELGVCIREEEEKVMSSVEEGLAFITLNNSLGATTRLKGGEFAKEDRQHQEDRKARRPLIQGRRHKLK